MKIDWKRKLSSRKFWAAVSGVVISAMVAFNANAESQEKVAGVITATGTLAIYMLAESSTDKAALNSDENTEEK
ncbi:MAG: hypothetical protein MRZ61_05365 [Oscillospiraceae bacterium]|nr:hypothetical protein [Oscillospiraceae bacterium]